MAPRLSPFLPLLFSPSPPVSVLGFSFIFLFRFVCLWLRLSSLLARHIPRPSATALADEGDDELFADALSHLASDTNNDNDHTAGGEGDIRSVAAGGTTGGRGGGGGVGGAPDSQLDEGEEATWAVEKEEALMVNRMFRM